MNLAVWLLFYQFQYYLYLIVSMKKEQQLKIREYLACPKKNQRPIEENQRHFVYLLTYLGEMFIQGYRIIEQFDDMIILSLMEFQLGQQLVPSQKRSAKKLPNKYKGVLWQYDESNIYESAAIRKGIFSRMASASLFFGDIQFNIIYLHTAKYSILNRAQLQRGGLPTCKDYYKKITWIELKNSFKPLQEKQQGIALHQLAQLFIKGAGEARNIETIKRMQNKNKFCYDLFYVIHTICYVVGKEMLENDYQAISSEKWMRYTTQKRFKRYDLLLRNEIKSGIIDWKFSKLMAQQKIKGNGVKNKNKQYYQLAIKDFRTDVELKFYCFHTRIYFATYHYFTCASYFHKVHIEQLDKMEKIEQIINIQEDSQSENQNICDGINKNSQEHQFKQNEEIEISSSSLSVNLQASRSHAQSVINLDDDDDQNDSKSTDKENKEIRNLSHQNKNEEQDQRTKIINDLIEDKVEEREEELIEKNEQEKQIYQESIIGTKKVDIKLAKFKEKFIDLTCQRRIQPVIDVIDID